ncbi:MAG: polymerase sigma factor, sigma-70 family [Gemmatimonadetes bacterium]|nr:polymerase sigma factor, sigma-70 family [Gemmatimonadota bacterium]
MTEDKVATLIAAASDRIRAQARRGVKDAARADDITQEALLRLWRSADKIDSPEMFAGWAHVITANLIKNEYRRQKSSSHIVLFQSFREAGDTEREPDYEDEAADVEKSFLDEERRAILRAKIKRLPYNFRRVLELVTFDQLNYEEASAVLGCGVGTVKSRIHRARQALLEVEPVRLYSRSQRTIVIPTAYRVVLRPTISTAPIYDRVARQIAWRAKRASKWTRYLLALRENGSIAVERHIGVALRREVQHSKLTMAWDWSAQHDGQLTTIVRGPKIYPDYGTLAEMAAKRIEALHVPGARERSAEVA